MIYYDIDGNEKRLKYLEVIKGDLRYIICHNPERAKRDLEKLEVKLDKIKRQIEDISRKPKSSGKLIKIFSRIYNINRFYDFGLDENKEFYNIFKDYSYNYEKLICGKYVLKTNDHDMSAKEIIEAYKNLGRIEHSFKDMKDF